MKASYFIASFLKTQGITHVFELSGGMITHILDSIAEVKGIDIITVHHEKKDDFYFFCSSYSKYPSTPL